MSAIDEITEAFRRKVAADGGMSTGVLSFLLDGLGAVKIDAREKPNRVTGSANPQHAEDSDCIVKMSVEALQALIQGKISGTDAVSNGKIEIVGDLRVAMAFGPAVGDLPRPVNELQFPIDSPDSK